MSDWKDPKTHREPKWPVGGFAPGDYMGKCASCTKQFIGMDKRAYQCFPCAVDDLKSSRDAAHAELSALKIENTTLKAAIRIVGSAELKDMSS